MWVTGLYYSLSLQYMNLIRFFFELLLLYILYKLVFELVIPMYNSTRIMKKKMESFREQNGTVAKNEPPRKDTAQEDYIDFEEVK